VKSASVRAPERSAPEHRLLLGCALQQRLISTSPHQRVPSPARSLTRAARRPLASTRAFPLPRPGVGACWGRLTVRVAATLRRVWQRARQRRQRLPGPQPCARRRAAARLLKHALQLPTGGGSHQSPAVTRAGPAVLKPGSTRARRAPLSRDRAPRRGAPAERGGRLLEALRGRKCVQPPRLGLVPRHPVAARLQQRRERRLPPGGPGGSWAAGRATALRAGERGGEAGWGNGVGEWGVGMGWGNEGGNGAGEWVGEQGNGVGNGVEGRGGGVGWGERGGPSPPRPALVRESRPRGGG
jgi:hypothetical protein